MSKIVTLAVLPFALLASGVSSTGCVSGPSAAPTVASARSSEGSLEQQVSAQLAARGGTQISPYEIAWHDGAVILAFPYPGEAQARASSPAAQMLQAEAGRKAAREAGVALGEAELQPQAGVGNCPTEVFGNDWYCFYELANYGGRRLQWNSKHPSNVYFSGYGLADGVSSWVNGGGKTVRVYNQIKGLPRGKGSVLWVENGHSSSKFVGSSNDDRADWFKTK